jgi:hypothetical protein
MRVGVDLIERVQACCDPHRDPIPVDPADLVRTEAEPVPPPRGGPTRRPR